MSGTVTGFSIVRTRAKVPAVCSDLADLPSIVKERVDKAAADHLRKGMQQMQEISIAQLRALIEKDGPERTQHTRLLNGAMRRASLDFEWSPAPLSNDAERWHLLGSGHAREDHFTVDDVDEMSTTGAGYGIWKGEDHEENFVHKVVSKRYKRCWMGHNESMKRENELPDGTMTTAGIKETHQAHMKGHVHRHSRSHVAAKTHIPSVTIVPHDEFDLNLANQDGGDWKWIEAPDGSWKRERVNKGEKVDPLKHPFDGKDPKSTDALPFQWKGEKLVLKMMREMKKAKLTSTRGCAAVLPLKPQTKVPGKNQVVSWNEMPITVTDIYHAMSGEHLVVPHTLTAESFVKPIFHMKDQEYVSDDESDGENDNPNFMSTKPGTRARNKMRMAHANSRVSSG